MIRSKQERSGPIVVDLTGPDGNAFALKNPTAEMMKGDYEHLLEVFDKNFGDYVILER